MQLIPVFRSLDELGQDADCGTVQSSHEALLHSSVVAAEEVVGERDVTISLEKRAAYNRSCPASPRSGPISSAHRPPSATIAFSTKEEAVEDLDSWSYLLQVPFHLIIGTGVVFVTRYGLDVLDTTLRLLRKPLGVILFFMTFSYILSLLFAHVSHTVQTALSPFCWVPGATVVPICAIPDAGYPSVDSPPKTIGAEEPLRVDFPSLMEIQGNRLDQLMEDKTRYSGVDLEITRVELRMRDSLIALRESELKSKETILRHLRILRTGSGEVTEHLQMFNSLIDGAVDKINAMNEYALRTIEELRERSSSMFAWLRLQFSLSRESEADMLKIFKLCMGEMEIQMDRIIMEAQKCLQELRDLLETLDTLSAVLYREDKLLREEREELLGRVWTILGGNKRQLYQMGEMLRLLEDVKDCSKRAFMHVDIIMRTVRGLREDMKELREQVAAPRLVGDSIPLEVQLMSIKAGLARVDATRERMKIGKRDSGFVQYIGIEDGKNFAASVRQ